MARVAWALLGILTGASPCFATIFVVVPGDTTFRIQDAIDIASYGDTVQLAPGNHVYWVTSGTVNGWSARAVAFLKNGVTIESQAGPENTFIDCQTTTARHGFVGEDLDATTVIRGLTFMDCEDSGFAGNGKWGGGILLYRSSVTIENCRFTRCTADGGGAVFLHEGDGVIRDCVFDTNTAGFLGGAVELYLTTGTLVENCTFVRSQAGDLGGALLVNSSEASVLRNIFWNSSAGIDGGAIGCLNSPVVTASCNIFWENNSGGEDHVSDACGISGVLRVADPRFCDSDAGDWTLSIGSPALPAGSDGCGLVGALPAGCGPVSVETVSWGRVKAGYR